MRIKNKMQIIALIFGLIIITVTMWCNLFPWWVGAIGITIVAFAYFYYLTQIKYPIE